MFSRWIVTNITSASVTTFLAFLAGIISWSVYCTLKSGNRRCNRLIAEVKINTVLRTSCFRSCLQTNVAQHLHVNIKKTYLEECCYRSVRILRVRHLMRLSGILLHCKRRERE
jgi:hypothetical protein